MNVDLNGPWDVTELDRLVKADEMRRSGEDAQRAQRIMELVENTKAKRRAARVLRPTVGPLQMNLGMEEKR